MWPGFESWRRRHMWVEFVVGSLPCSERFFSGYSGFPLSLKNQHFQIPIRSGTHGHVSTSSYELLSAPWVNKLQFTNFYNLRYFGLQHKPKYRAIPKYLYYIKPGFHLQSSHKRKRKNPYFTVKTACKHRNKLKN